MCSDANGYGPIEMRVRLDVGLMGDLRGFRASLAETAYSLARMLDEGAGMGTASVARELRITLAEIEKGPGHDDDPTAGIIASLGIPDGARVPTSVRDTEDRPPDIGSEGQ